MNGGSFVVLLDRKRRGADFVPEKNLETKLVDIVTLLKAVGNERRFEIVYYLLSGERAVGELEELVGLSQSALSQHLARLRRDGMVKTRRDAQKIYYSIADQRVADLLASLCDMHQVVLPAANDPEKPSTVRMFRSA